jgi:hypothetical protein
VVRLASFANCATAPTIVGGQMLYLLHPDQLHVGAEATPGGPASFPPKSSPQSVTLFRFSFSGMTLSTDCGPVPTGFLQ